MSAPVDTPPSAETAGTGARDRKHPPSTPSRTVPVVRFTVKGQTDAPSLGEPGRRYTIVYDGACNVCQGLVRRLARWDRYGVFEVVPSQRTGVQARFPWIPARAYAESVQLIRRDGLTWQGAAALEQIIDELPKGRLVTWIFSIPFVRPLAEWFYRWFARNRYRLGCGEHCQFRPSELAYEEAGGGKEEAGGSSGPGA
jgi:predicted DCC family thiol-disulfide oxidoreductase YuxK